jgi:hypothetical protein
MWNLEILHEARHHFNGQRENDGRFFLRSNGIERLEIAQLQLLRDKKLISRLPLCKSGDNLIKRTCIAVDVELIISAASRKALAAFRSPLAAMTLALDSRAASASAAMGRCI